MKDNMQAKFSEDDKLIITPQNQMIINQNSHERKQIKNIANDVHVNKFNHKQSFATFGNGQMSEEKALEHK